LIKRTIGCGAHREIGSAVVGDDGVRQRWMLSGGRRWGRRVVEIHMINQRHDKWEGSPPRNAVVVVRLRDSDEVAA
jgi:hypothetical protein